MLTLTALTDAEYLISSVALSIDEYYAGVGESPGVWAGRWAEALGLSGVVEAEELRALVEGRDPGTGEPLLAGNRERTVRAFDMTFSAPKSVSLLWAFAGEPVAEVVAAAHREAVAVALEFLEERAAAARVQAGGMRRRVGTEGWVVAGFGHRTSREGDPQLHTHCLVPNLVRRKTDGRYVAFDAGPLFDWCRAAGSVYQNELQRSLSLRLGVAWGPDCHNTREMLGFSRAQLRAFSKRSAQIEAELEAKGALYESPALRMQADDEASLATRTRKDHSLTPTLLQGRWLEEAAAVGMATGPGLEKAVCWKEPATGAPGWDEVAAALVSPETGLCSRLARFTAADVVEHVCAISGGRLSVEEVVIMAERFLASELVVRLTPDVDEGRRRPAQWSTAAHREMEDRTVALMGSLTGRQLPAVTGAVLEAALAAAPGLGEDQAAAVRVLAGKGGGLRAVLAPAGYGKTTMLHSAAQAATGDGRPIVAVATTARAVAELAGAGLEATTIARLRLDLGSGPLAAGTVVVLDEVSQTPTHEVETVLAAVDACPCGSLWVLGDPRQSQPVGAGGVADHIERLANAGVIPVARLTVNRRQVDLADQEALGLLRRGDAAGSQQVRSEHGWEHELATPGETRRAMADAVCTDIGRYGALLVAVLVVSHTDAEDLGDRIRARLAATGTLTGPALVGPGGRPSGSTRPGTGSSSTPAAVPRAARSSTAPPPRSPVPTATAWPSGSTPAGQLQACRRRSSRAPVRTVRPTSRTPGRGRWTGHRAAPGKPATCSAAAPWTPIGVTPASPVLASPPTPGTPPGWWSSTTAASWPTSGTRLNRWRTRWPASPTRPWPPAGTPGCSTERSADGSPSTNGCWAPGPRTAERSCSPRPRASRPPSSVCWTRRQPLPARPTSWPRWVRSPA